MGSLTDDMAQLRENIDSSRRFRLAQQNARISSVSMQVANFSTTRVSNGMRDAQARAEFIANNVDTVNQSLGGFHHARQVMGQQGRETRTAFTSTMSKEISALLKSFNTNRKNMAEQSSKNRAEVNTTMTNSITSFIKEASQDRLNANAAFFGIVASKKNDMPRLAIQLITEPLVEKQEVVLIPSEIQESVQSEQPEPTLSFTPPDDLVKLEIFSEPNLKATETKRTRRKHSYPSES